MIDIKVVNVPKQLQCLHGERNLSKSWICHWHERVLEKNIAFTIFSFFISGTVSNNNIVQCEDIFPASTFYKERLLFSKSARPLQTKNVSQCYNCNNIN